MKLESKYFTFLYITLTVPFVIYQFIINRFDFQQIINIFFISVILVGSIYFIYKKYNFYQGNWKKIGNSRFIFNATSYIYLIIILIISFFFLFCYFKNDKTVMFSDFYFHVLFVSSLFTYNNHLVLKNKYLTLIDDNRFKDYDKDEIKYIAIKNNNLAIAIIKNDKVYNFPIEDFKEKELNLLNQFIKIENLQELQITI